MHIALQIFLTQCILLVLTAYFERFSDGFLRREVDKDNMFVTIPVAYLASTTPIIGCLYGLAWIWDLV